MQSDGQGHPQRDVGRREQICPPRQALSHGKVPAESGTAEPDSSLCCSVTAWGRLRGAGRDRLASPSPFTRLRSTSAEMLRCSRGPGADAETVAHPALRVPSFTGHCRKAMGTWFLSLRGTCSHFARSPRSPLQGSLQDTPPHKVISPPLIHEQQFLLIIAFMWHSHHSCCRAGAKQFSLC